MVGLKQRPNTLTDSATGPMTEVTTPDPTGALQGGGQPLPLLPESDGGSSDWAQPRFQPGLTGGAMDMANDNNSERRLDIRNWLAGKHYWLVIVLVSGFVSVVAIELFTNIDLGLVPNDPHQEELAP
jgi:hypothetical protein